jgi:hypothetical protein
MPRLAPPRRRAIFVDAPASSMNTNCSGPRSGVGFEPCALQRENVGSFLLAGVRRFFTVIEDGLGSGT